MTDQRGGSQSSGELSKDAECCLQQLRALQDRCSKKEPLFQDVVDKRYLLLWSGVDGTGQPNRDRALLKLAQQVDVNAQLPTKPEGSPWGQQPKQRTEEVKRLEGLASKAAEQPGCPFAMIDFTCTGKQMAELDRKARDSGVDRTEIETTWKSLSEKFVQDFANNPVPFSSKATITFSEGSSSHAVVQKEIGQARAEGPLPGISTSQHHDNRMSNQMSEHPQPTSGPQIH